MEDTLVDYVLCGPGCKTTNCKPVVEQFCVHGHELSHVAGREESSLFA